MNEINKLGWRVALVTAVVITIVFGTFWGIKKLWRTGGEEPKKSQQSEADSTRDSDGDGVADFYETKFYNTDPNKADTDGDGVTDLEEILDGRDPLKAGPGDEIKPKTGSQAGKQDTYTRQYLATLPDNVAKKDILNQARLEGFVAENEGSLLPEVTAADIKTTADEGKEAIVKYLDAISSVQNSGLKPVTSTDLEEAFRQQIYQQNTRSMDNIVKVLTDNAALLEQVPAPAEAQELHVKLVAATRALRNSAVALRNIQADFVGGLIAAKKVEELGAIFQDIAGGVQALEQKYGIT